MRDRYDSDTNNRQARQRAYTGETIVIRRARDAALPARRSVRRRIRRALILTGVLLTALIALFYWQFAAAVAPLIIADARPFPPLNPPGTPINVLLIGVDERPDHPEEGVRSDTLIVVRLDTFGRRVSLLSIPRDTRVDLRDIGPTKINVAYGHGYASAAQLYGAATTPAQGGDGAGRRDC